MGKPKESGYTHCACRDCFEIVVSDDMANPDFCDDCIEVGCEPDHECSSPHAYGGDEDEEGDEDSGGHDRDREDFCRGT